MSNVIDFILTNAASELISKVLAGKTLNFTRMAVGDGFSYDLTAAKNYTSLVNEVLSLDITKKETLSPSSVRITSAFKNTDAQKEFYYREVGLYAKDPDTGEEVLYAYGNRNDAAELITPAGSNIVTKQLIFIISVGDSANVTFNVNADIYALQEDMLDVQANKADKNLANTGMITNCLLEIPQNIKLELNDGVLTLKAGSVVTSPNGEQKIIESDVNYRSTWTAGQMVILYSDSLGLNYSPLVIACISGDTEPINPAGGSWWFDTQNKIFKLFHEGIWIEHHDFYVPIGLATATTEGFISIDQVFNSMSYFGSTVWVDKGVKGLIPNGIDKDGTLANINTGTQDICMFTFDSTFNGPYIMSLTTGPEYNIVALYCKHADYVYRQNEKPQGFDKWWYHINENQWKYIYDNGKIANFWWLDVCECNVENGVITSLKPYVTFEAINKSSDKPWLSSLSMPSEKYIELELGERSTTYTAPANGWFAIRKITGIPNGSFTFAVWNPIGPDEIYRTTMCNHSEIAEIAFSVPISKGQIVAVDYDATGKTEYFRFIYAQGETD